jgi:drug/metabolite transporter (DMT)-like permease
VVAHVVSHDGAGLLPARLAWLAGIRRASSPLYAGIGVVVAVHWLTFYGSIKLANASVAATCMALAPAVTALIEPRSRARVRAT